MGDPAARRHASGPAREGDPAVAGHTLLKGLELAGRRFWIRTLTALLRQPTTPPPDWSRRPYRVLFLRHDRAGDMILSTGALRHIARSHPTIVLDVLASPVNASLLDAAEYVRRVLVFDKRRASSYVRTIAELRGGYDAVIDCMVTAPSLTTLLLMAVTGAPYRIGIAGRGGASPRSDAINVPVRPSRRHHIADKIGGLSAAFGLDAESIDWRPEIALTSDEAAAADLLWSGGGSSAAVPAGRRVLVNVSAGTAARRWPVERYVAVVRH